MIGAGSLSHRVAFDRRISGNPDGSYDLGGTETGWVEQFQCRAAYVHLRGGEAIMAGRLQGRHTQIIRIRAFSLARLVSTDWRIRDVRSGTFIAAGSWQGVAFNIRDITPSDDRAWLDFLCERGVAI